MSHSVKFCSRELKLKMWSGLVRFFMLEASSVARPVGRFLTKSYIARRLISSITESKLAAVKR